MGEALWVLVVEDHEGWQRRLARVIVQMGYSMRGAFTLEEGRQLIKQQQFDLGIFDVHLPDGFGIDLVPVFKLRNPSGRALVCSGYACVKAAQWAYAAGADLFAETTAENVDGFLKGEPRSTEPVTRPTLDEWKMEYVHRVVLESGGNRSAAASVLGLRRQSLQRMLKRERKRSSD